MARRRNPPDSVRLKGQVAERLRTIRKEQLGDGGLADLARQLGVPVRTWYSYEAGVTVPAEIVLRFVELTWVNPNWLLHGRGPKYLKPYQPNDEHRLLVESSALTSSAQAPSVNAHAGESGSVARRPVEALDRALPPSVWLEAVSATNTPARTATDGPFGQCQGRYLRVTDDAMVPIVAAGGFVAYAEDSESLAALDKKLVVAQLPEGPVVRWFHRLGDHAVLRAENPAFEPASRLIDLEAGGDCWEIRRVLWVGTAH